jgi:hypothetical protein
MDTVGAVEGGHVENVASTLPPTQLTMAPARSAAWGGAPVIGVPRSRSSSSHFPRDSRVRGAGRSTLTREPRMAARVKLARAVSVGPPGSRREPQPDRPGAPKSKILSPACLTCSAMKLHCSG